MTELRGNDAIALRAERPGDQDFLQELYATTREEELSLTAWSAAQKSAFLNLQFAAQTRAYAAQFPDARRAIVEYQGAPIGWFVVNETDQELRLVDVALLTEFRGRGIGSALIRDLQGEASLKHKAIRLHVLKANRALRLYCAAGFKETGSDEVYVAMEWNPNR